MLALWGFQQMLSARLTKIPSVTLTIMVWHSIAECSRVAAVRISPLWNKNNIHIYVVNLLSDSLICHLFYYVIDILYTTCPSCPVFFMLLACKSKVKIRIAVCKQASPLRKLTYHMGSHSVTCHPAEVTFPPLPHVTLQTIRYTRWAKK